MEHELEIADIVEKIRKLTSQPINISAPYDSTGMPVALRDDIAAYGLLRRRLAELRSLRPLPGPPRIVRRG